MMRFFIVFLLVSFVFAPKWAHATVNVYDNPEFGYSLNYPDDWMAQAETAGLPHTYKIVAEEGRSSAYCQVTTSIDKRFQIYGPDIMPQVLSKELGPDFWATQLANYNEVRFLEVYETSGVAGAPGTRVLADYIDNRSRPHRAWFGATVLDGVQYVTQCAAFQEDFSVHEKMFHSIMATLKTKSAFHPFINGFYRDFTGDRPILYLLADGIGTIEFN